MHHVSEMKFELICLSTDIITSDSLVYFCHILLLHVPRLFDDPRENAKRDIDTEIILLRRDRKKMRFARIHLSRSTD